MASTAVTSVSSSKPKSQSPHVSDPVLQPFLSSTFSPSDYLNNTFPPLSHTPKPPQTLSLTDLASRTQAHVAQLSAQTTRLSDTLTDLTDDILRSSSRLAYEVEVLRGETVSLTELLTEGLTDEIAKFLPQGIDTADSSGPNPQPTPQKSPTTTPSQPSTMLDANSNNASEPPVSTDSFSSPHSTIPSSISRLRTLQAVRTRLQTVISTFDTALSWPLPPSLTASASLPSSILTISAPPSSSTASLSQQSAEQQGQAACQRLKNEITDLLDMGGAEGILAAEERVEALRELVGVWKGTAEEKARGKFVEGLGKIVGERRKEEERKGVDVGRKKQGVMGRSGSEFEVQAEADHNGGGKATSSGSGSGPGFLRRLRDEIYLE